MRIENLLVWDLSDDARVQYVGLIDLLSHTMQEISVTILVPQNKVPTMEQGTMEQGTMEQGITEQGICKVCLYTRVGYNTITNSPPILRRIPLDSFQKYLRT